jgi:hypothetical protein
VGVLWMDCHGVIPTIFFYNRRVAIRRADGRPLFARTGTFVGALKPKLSSRRSPWIFLTGLTG